MLWTIDFTIPANTPRENPVEASLTVEGDVITWVSILIPSGHFALAGMKILYGNKPLIPEEVDMWIKGNNETLQWEDYIPLPERETTLRFMGYNLDTDNDHTFYVRIVTRYRWQLAPYEMLGKAVDGIIRLLRRMGFRVE